MSKQKKSQQSFTIAQVALPVPLRRLFDYCIPTELETQSIPGVRVIVPFGRRKLTGLLIKQKHNSDLPEHKIRSIISVIDNDAIVSPTLLKLLLWTADYYQQPLGEVVKTALPAVYKPKTSDLTKTFSLAQDVDANQLLDSLKRAPVQKRIVALLTEAEEPLSADHFKSMGSGWRNALNVLIDKKRVEVGLDEQIWTNEDRGTAKTPPTLSDEQAVALDQLSQTLTAFNVSLLKGVTGSGKTEVYLQLAQSVLKLGRQILVLVPEIALTPQLVSRFEQRLGFKTAVLHSSLSEKQRRMAWQAGASGRAKVVLGTRSAIFSALPDVGLIILDEEHDMSYKQHEGVHYHARDVAVMRAKLQNIPIVMGSATPSLESLANVRRGRYALSELNKRVANAHMPAIHLLDLDQLRVKEGLSITLLNAIEKNLKDKKQTLIFINRRGYAPVVVCKQCGQSATCSRCHARLTYHHDGSLQCHHCGGYEQSAETCQWCQSQALIKLGQGTQRIEHLLKRLYPNARIARLDRDAIRKKDELDSLLDSVSAKDVDILIGTQMLAKGHDFPFVTLVGVVNADQGLFGLDFHSTESMIQQLIQVSGRAGRARNPGRVLIQSHFPEHPLYQHVSQHDYVGFAQNELTIREQAGFPPYYYLALIRASARDEALPLKFLHQIKNKAMHLNNQFPAVTIMDPVYSPMAKRQDRYRAQLLISSQSRSQRSAFLKTWISQIESLNARNQVRWSVDVDPLDLY